MSENLQDNSKPSPVPKKKRGVTRWLLKWGGLAVALVVLVLLGLNTSVTPNSESRSVSFDVQWGSAVDQAQDNASKAADTVGNLAGQGVDQIKTLTDDSETPSETNQ